MKIMKIGIKSKYNCQTAQLEVERIPTRIESRWGRDVPPVQTGPGAHPASCTMGTRSFPWGKVQPGCAADHSPPCSAAVMEE